MFRLRLTKQYLGVTVWGSLTSSHVEKEGGVKVFLTCSGRLFKFYFNLALDTYLPLHTYKTQHTYTTPTYLTHPYNTYNSYNSYTLHCMSALPSGAVALCKWMIRCAATFFGRMSHLNLSDFVDSLLKKGGVLNSHENLQFWQIAQPSSQKIPRTSFRQKFLCNKINKLSILTLFLAMTMTWPPLQ